MAVNLCIIIKSRLQKKWILQIIWSFNFSFVSFTIPIPYKIKRCVCITFCVMSFSHSWYFPNLCAVSYNSKVWEIKIVETINCAFLYIGSAGWMDGLLVGWLAVLLDLQMFHFVLQQLNREYAYASTERCLLLYYLSFVNLALLSSKLIYIYATITISNISYSYSFI